MLIFNTVELAQILEHLISKVRDAHLFVDDLLRMAIATNCILNFIIFAFLRDKLFVLGHVPLNCIIDPDLVQLHCANVLEWADALDVVHLFHLKAAGLVHWRLRHLLGDSHLAATRCQLIRIIAVQEVGDKIAAEGSRLARLN